jgi:hypothetical protein
MPNFVKLLAFYFVGQIAVNALQYRPRNAEDLATVWIAATHQSAFAVAPLALLIIIILTMLNRKH